MDVIDAIKKNDSKWIKISFHRREFDKNATIHVGKKTPKPLATPLVYAVEQKNLAMVQLILNLKADANKSVEGGEQDGINPLCLAAKLGCLDIVKALAENKADVNYKRKDGYTPLHAAVETDQHEITQYLIGKKANVNVLLEGGRFGTPLYYATECGKNVKCASILLQAGANVDLTSSGLETPLFNSIKKGFSSMIPLLLKYKATQKYEGKSLVFAAVQSGHPMCIKRVLENKSVLSQLEKRDIEATNDNGDTPLLLVARSSNPIQSLKDLIEKGADVNAQNKEGMTALHFVCLAEDDDKKELLIKLLLDNGAIKKANNCGEYPKLT